MLEEQAFIEIQDSRALAQAIVDTIREPLLVLDHDLRVIAASRSFYQKFHVSHAETRNQLLYALGDGQWNIPELRLELEKIIREHAVMEAFEVEREFPHIGRLTMLLNARKVFYEGNSDTTLLLAIEDVSERRAAEREMKELLQQKEMLLGEMQHRIANSLQIIASILLLKARTVSSEETRKHLQDAHQRVMSVAALQHHLQASGRLDRIEIGPYLSKLCETLAASMIGEGGRVSLDVLAQEGSATSNEAVSIGLIVTELVINALKHAFPDGARVGKVIVAYEAAGAAWKLSVSDNGSGKLDASAGQSRPKPGLGTSIVDALAKQLEARVEVLSDPQGTSVSVSHASFASAVARP